MSSMAGIEALNALNEWAVFMIVGILICIFGLLAIILFLKSEEKDNKKRKFWNKTISEEVISYIKDKKCKHKWIFKTIKGFLCSESILYCEKCGSWDKMI